MKKTLIMFGNDNFESIIYKNGCMKVKPNKLMARLTWKNNVINFSNESININKAKSLLSLCIDSNISIDGCYIALSDLLVKSDNIQLFKDELIDLITYLNELNIPCLIFDKLNKNTKSALEYEDIVNFLSNNYEFKPVAHRTIELKFKLEQNGNTCTNLCM